MIKVYTLTTEAHKATIRVGKGVDCWHHHVCIKGSSRMRGSFAASRRYLCGSCFRRMTVRLATITDLCLTDVELI